MSYPPNNSSSTINNSNEILRDHIINRLQLQDSDNKDPYEDFRFDKEEEASENEDNKPHLNPARLQTIYRKESMLKDEIVYRILNGKSHNMKPNSGETIHILESDISLWFHTEEEGEYRLWEWHGHIVGYTNECRFSPEYIYGNYFERIGLEEPPCV